MRILVADDDLVTRIAMEGSPRIEQLISDALALLAEGQTGAERTMAQAVYWLERVSGRAA